MPVSRLHVLPRVRARRGISRPLLLAVASVMVAAGCGGGNSSGGGGTGSDTPVPGGELVMAINVEGKTMDPVWCASNAFERCVPVFGTLMRYDVEDEQFVPSMASSFDSEDGRTWTLTLRDGVRFTDGTPFDADAVVFNWDRIKDPANLSPSALVAAPLTWRVVDPLTVEVVSEQTNFQLPWALTQGLGMIGSPTAIAQLGPDFGNAPIGAGPFTLDTWVRNSKATYTANPGYWNEGAPYLDSYVLEVIGQDDQRLNALRAGEVDIDWSLLAKDAKAIEAEGYTVHSLPLVGGTGLNFNLEDPDLKDPQLRLAILRTFDSAQINSAVYPGDEPVDAFLYPDSPYRDDSLGKFPEKGIDEAQKLFDEYLDRTGQSDLTLRLSTFAGLPALEQVSQILQSQAQQIDGLTIQIDAMDYATLEGALNAGEFQLGIAAALSQNMDGIYERFHSNGTRNITGYSNPKVDEAFETSRASQDPEAVSKAYEVVNGEISNDAPLRNWRYQTGYLFTQDYVKDLIITGTPSGAGVYLDEAWVDK
ncbi:ABC transporter substrate-binding protein [Rhodococcus artemisiae]|uniref:ABC transporter substrate-binding protein n=1 Tax=Rhodococcus artemisiae TaxID=714159 RepID=A0ABU7L4L5_9NOCA|nr:ABC transporter substrate-binding protein [Rhodococcus artemisiae]MEE2056477.1 ABC transporter substrate-binding protein [Rhodococcus artemisiae]